MGVAILEMNGERISRTLNYLPQGRGFYNIVVKDRKMVRCNNAEECLAQVKKLSEEVSETIYVKVPAGIHSVSVDELRIA